MSSNNLDKTSPTMGRNIQNPKSENIATVPEISTFTSIVSESEDIHSGQSLFKTFVFNQCVNDAEIDKCKTFWESVMKKKLEPIKCSIIKERLKKSEISTKKDSSKCKDEIKKAVERVHLQYRELWSNMMQEVKKRKLDELKLIGKRKCMFCSRFYPRKCHLNKENEAEIRDDIKKLSCWKSSNDRVCGKDEGSTKEFRKNTAKGPVPTSKYKLVNVIDERKKDNYYSRWREQAIKCDCGLENCNCKKQQYISIIKSPVLGDSQVSVNIVCDERKNMVDLPLEVHFSSQLMEKEINPRFHLSDIPLQHEQQTSLPNSKAPSREKSPIGKKGISIVKVSEEVIQNMPNEANMKEIKQYVGPPVASLIKKNSLEMATEGTHSTDEVTPHITPIASIIKDSLEIARERMPSICITSAKHAPSREKSPVSKRGTSILKVSHEVNQNVPNEVRQYLQPPVASLTTKNSLKMARETTHSKDEVTAHTVTPIASLIKNSLVIAREETPSMCLTHVKDDKTNISIADDAKKGMMCMESDEKLYLTPSCEKPETRKSEMSILRASEAAIQNIANEVNMKEVEQYIEPPVASLIRKDSLEMARERTHLRVEVPPHTVTPIASLTRQDSLEITRKRAPSMCATSMKADQTNISIADDAKEGLMCMESAEKLYLTPPCEKPRTRRGMSILKIPNLASQNN